MAPEPERSRAARPAGSPRAGCGPRLGPSFRAARISAAGRCTSAADRVRSRPVAGGQRRGPPTAGERAAACRTRPRHRLPPPGVRPSRRGGLAERYASGRAGSRGAPGVSRACARRPRGVGAPRGDAGPTRARARIFAEREREPSRREALGVLQDMRRGRLSVLRPPRRVAEVAAVACGVPPRTSPRGAHVRTPLGGRWAPGVGLAPGLDALDGPAPRAPGGPSPTRRGLEEAPAAWPQRRLPDGTETEVRCPSAPGCREPRGPRLRGRRIADARHPAPGRPGQPPPG